MKLGLYSITYPGYSPVEIDGKRPHGNPMDIDAKSRQEIRAITAEQDDESVWAAVRGVGEKQMHSHFGGEYVRTENGYDGYLCYEFCHRAQNVQHELQGREYVDEQAALAREYLNSLLPIGAPS
jgi:hypothetical protein